MSDAQLHLRPVLRFSSGISALLRSSGAPAVRNAIKASDFGYAHPSRKIFDHPPWLWQRPVSEGGPLEDGSGPRKLHCFRSRRRQRLRHMAGSDAAEMRQSTRLQISSFRPFDCQDARTAKPEDVQLTATIPMQPGMALI